MKTIIHRTGFDGESLYDHTDQKRVYQRVVGGIGWPGERPGFAVVVGEEKTTKPRPHIYVVREIEEPNALDLIRRCTELQADCCVSTWYGFMDDSHREILMYHNREAQKRQLPGLQIQPPPEAEGDRLTHSLNILLSCLKPEAKTLTLGTTSRLKAYLMEIQDRDVATARASEHPAVAALAAAVSALRTWEWAPPIEEEGFSPLSEATGY